MNIKAISAQAEMFRNSALCILHSELHSYAHWNRCTLQRRARALLTEARLELTIWWRMTLPSRQCRRREAEEGG